MRFSRAFAVEHELVFGVAHVDALVVGRASVGSGRGAVWRRGAVALGLVGAVAVGGVVTVVVAAVAACGARSYFLLLGEENDLINICASRGGKAKGEDMGWEGNSGLGMYVVVKCRSQAEYRL